jgi:hypothetical protein
MSLVTPGQKLKQAVGGAVVAVLGRRRIWRLGRAIYRVARNDVDNDPARNGERWLQARVLDLFRWTTTPTRSPRQAQLSTYSTCGFCPPR